MSDWKVTSARVVLFSGMRPSAPLSALEYFKQVWGGDPEQFQKGPSPLMPSVAQARRGGVAVGCSTQQTRLDFTLSAPVGPTAMITTKLPQIEDANLVTSEFARIFAAVRSSVNWGSMNRVALSLQLQNQETSLLEANRALMLAMPECYRVTIEDEEDFALQVNRPFISSTLGGLRVNSLSKWSVDTFKILNLQIGPGNIVSQQSSTLTPSSQDLVASSWSLDVNCNAIETAIDPREQAELLVEAQVRVMSQLTESGLNVKGLRR